MLNDATAIDANFNDSMQVCKLNGRVALYVDIASRLRR